MATKEVDISGIGLVKLSKKRGNKNIRMSIGRSGGVKVSMPTWVPYKAGEEFAKNRIDWIEKNKPKPTEPLNNGMRIGKAHRLEFVRSSNDKPTVRTGNGKIKINYPENLTVYSESVQAAANRGAIKALKSESELLLPQRLKQLATQTGFNYNSVSFKRLVSRWGSCSQNKDITLNIYLMQLPWHLIDYVIIHELVHTQHLNHGEDFWNTFEKFKPGAKKLKKELKNYSTIVSPESVD